MAEKSAIYIGTSGWSYPKGAGTWAGYFYPAGTTNELGYYSHSWTLYVQLPAALTRA